MKILVVFLLCVNAMSVFSDFDDGLNAYNEGDFKTALREWRPLAEQGHAEAQVNLGVLYESGSGVPQNLDLERFQSTRFSSQLPKRPVPVAAGFQLIVLLSSIIRSLKAVVLINQLSSG